jgi:subtilisin family serine protease
MRLPVSYAFPALVLAACASAGSTPVPRSPAPAAPPIVAPRGPITEAPAAWHLLDATADGVPGISARRAYSELLVGKEPQRLVVVAVIDIGVDTAHPDLRPNLWRNPREVAGNRADDDRNGYVDDIYGWNFIGGPDGRNIDDETYEVTRLYRQCTSGSGGGPSPSMSVMQREQCGRIVADFQNERAEMTQNVRIMSMLAETMKTALPLLSSAVGGDSLTEARVRALRPTTAALREAQSLYLQISEAGIDPADLEEQSEVVRRLLEFGLNPSFDPRGIVGDDPNDLSERIYGNRDVTGPDALHGTHVAGIIGAVRNNGLAVDGIAPAVRIMSVRAVPNGDERDKDVANAIRYAVDNGAQIINLSFGKGYSPQKEAVDDAVRHAETRGVLIVHAAGNEGEDAEANPSFPTPIYERGGRAANWIEVGASSWRGGDRLAAPFSNYGARIVDVFAPGVDILSTDVGGGIVSESGTSMAAPVVTGVAALLMGYYPDLTPADVKRIIVGSVVPYRDVMVEKPGEDGVKVPFGSLSAAGGIVNVYNALKMAASMRPTTR